MVKMYLDSFLFYRMALIWSFCLGLSACGGSAPVTPSISTQPTSQTVLAGEKASFSVVASGDTPLTYQWQRNGTDVTGAVSANYSLAAVQFSDDDSVWTVRISNTAGSVVSTPAKLTVKPAQNGIISLLMSDRNAGQGLLALDSAGNMYVSPTNDSVQKITPAGVSTTLTTGLNSPKGIAVDAAGNVYVADNVNGLPCPPGCNPNYAGIIRKISPTGLTTILAGSALNATGVDGIGVAASFNTLSGMVIDASGNLYVGEYYDGRIRKISPEGVVTTVATGLPFVWGLALDGGGNIYASSNIFRAVGSSGRGAISKVSPTGMVMALAGNLAETGSNDGPGAVARFASAYGMAVDRAGDVFVADPENNTIRKISPKGMVSTVTGQSGNEIILGPLPGNIPYPLQMAFDAQGALYVVAAGGFFKIQFSN